jgi:hypothetical protein
MVELLGELDEDSLAQSTSVKRRVRDSRARRVICNMGWVPLDEVFESSNEVIGIF